MSYNKYKSIADVLQDFPIIYQEENFIQEIPLTINTFQSFDDVVAWLNQVMS